MLCPGVSWAGPQETGRLWLFPALGCGLLFRGGTRGLRRLMLLGLGLQFVRERQRPGQTLTLTVRLCAVPKPLVLGENVKHSSSFILL